MVDKERVWLITGASRGLGRSLAELASEEGDRVVLAVRDPSSVANLLAQVREELERIKATALATAFET
jgi:NAD(P)-dependent dehydrogenase (short-subunit alcohol dehydrogenase family)